MRKPRIGDLKADAAGTRRLRAAMAGPRRVKTTINLDADSLAKLKELSADSSVPYQRLLNQLLRERLSRVSTGIQFSPGMGIENSPAVARLVGR